MSEAASESDGRVAERLRGWLSERGVAFREVTHPPTLTSEDSARERGEPLSIGGKALLLKLDGEFALFVLGADRRLDSAAVRNALQVRKSRFATREELWESTGLVPGSVPPFGAPLLPFALYADDSILSQPRIAFNAGRLTRSMVLAIEDWIAVAQPRRLSFAAPP